MVDGSGGSCYIGEIDETTVLKYAQPGENPDQVRIEAKILDVLGPHPRIIQSQGLTEHGLLLEFMPNGNVYDYLLAHPDVSLDRRLVWCVQAAEAVAFIHSRRVLHCDIRHDNFLVDANLDLRLADFQGLHFSPAGEVLFDGGSCESVRASLPRSHPFRSCVRSDLFALGSAIQFLVTGAKVFPDIVKCNDTQEDVLRWFHEGVPEVERRFRACEFPPVDEHACSAVTARCWRQLYKTADQVLADLKAIRAAVARGDAPETCVTPPDGSEQPCEEEEPWNPPATRGQDLVGV